MTPTTQTTETGTAGAGPAVDRPFVPAEDGGGRVDSETGRLHEVIVHRPGREIARITPINADSLLFDDALNISRAQAEHDAFTEILRDEGVIVHDFRELLAETLAVPRARALVLTETVGPEAVGVSTSEVLTDYLQGLPDTDLAEVMLAGITRSELRERLDPADAATLFDTTFLSTLEGQFVITPLPNHVFTRDTSAWLYGGVSVNTMALAPRRREAVNTELDAVMHLDTLMTMVTPDTYLRFSGFNDVTTVEIEPGASGKALHVTVHDGSEMDSVLARAAGIDSFRVISPDMSDEAEALRELSRDSCNVVALSPGRVIGYAHNQAANDVLRRAGVDVIETPGVELVRGRGGSHCMTCPVTRGSV